MYLLMLKRLIIKNQWDSKPFEWISFSSEGCYIFSPLKAFIHFCSQITFFNNKITVKEFYVTLWLTLLPPMWYLVKLCRPPGPMAAPPKCHLLFAPRYLFSRYNFQRTFRGKTGISNESISKFQISRILKINVIYSLLLGTFLNVTYGQLLLELFKRH